MGSQLSHHGGSICTPASNWAETFSRRRLLVQYSDNDFKRFHFWGRMPQQSWCIYRGGHRGWDCGNDPGRLRSRPSRLVQASRFLSFMGCDDAGVG